MHSHADHGHAQDDHAGLGHTHGTPGSDSKVTRAFFIALLLTLGFMGFEVWGGLVFGSLALLADAAHMASDAAALALSFFVARIAIRPRNFEQTFGYRRAEVIGALANGASLFVVAAWIMVEAFERFGDSSMPIQGKGMAITAAVGLCVNLVVAYILSGASDNMNVRGALLHVLGDMLGSVAALIAAGVIVLTGWQAADPIASSVIAVVILFSAIRLVKECVHMLMQGTPQNLDCSAVENTIRQTEGVTEVHDLHVWSLTAGAPILSAHIVLDADRHGTELTRVVGQRLKAIHGIEHVTIQPEASAPIIQLRIPGRVGGSLEGSDS